MTVPYCAVCIWGKIPSRGKEASADVMMRVPESMASISAGGFVDASAFDGQIFEPGMIVVDRLPLAATCKPISSQGLP
jgi:hypothetical protein